MKLLENYQLGALSLKNRMVMAAMTRSRADSQGLVGDMTVEYYRQRSTAGLIITEAIDISADAVGSPFTPGLYTPKQITAWKKVTDAVHAQGSKIFAQLWHTGRVSHSTNRHGKLPLAPSAIKIEGMQHFTAAGLVDYEVPNEMSVADIQQTIADFAKAANNAIQAGFDGVEFHAANGYLPQQFLSDSANQRDDAYGGSIENKARFTLEALAAMSDAIGADKVGIKISPLHPYANIIFDNPHQSYGYLINKLNQLDILFVEYMKRGASFPLLPHYPTDDEIEIFGKLINKPLIANGGYLADSAEAELNKGIAQLISFGASFLANPDLPRRFSQGAPLNLADRATMFGGDAKGYIDYPTLENN